MTYILVKRKTNKKQAEKGKNNTRACSDLGGVMEDVME